MLYMWKVVGDNDNDVIIGIVVAPTAEIAALAAATQNWAGQLVRILHFDEYEQIKKTCRVVLGNAKPPLSAN